MDVRDLIHYNHTLRRLYFEALVKLPWNEVVKSRGASFDSMRNIFLHLTLVEDRWINYIIPGRFKDWVNPVFDEFKDFDSLHEFMLRVEENMQDYLRKSNVEDLRREIVIPWGDTPDTRRSIRTVLCHMVVEDLLHYGELSSLLWQLDVEAPYLAFWRYKSNNDTQGKTP